MKELPLSPDGRYYLRAAAGQLVPRPYAFRYLWPRLLGPRPKRWVAATRLSLALLPVATWFYFSPLPTPARAFATLLLCALPGLRLSLHLPVLIDAPSFTLSLAVAALARSHPYLAALAALPLGSLRETGPVFAAAWSLSPYPLVGLLATGWFRPHAPADEVWLAHPFREAVALRRKLGLSAELYVLPLGAALLGLSDVRSWPAVALAHAQLLFAQDTLRLTVWATPPLCLAAATLCPSWLWPAAFVWTAIQTPRSA